MIDARQLMVGDWVKRFDENFQIKPYQFTQCNFEPIPLTAELLEKNEWKEYPQVYSNQTLNFDIYRFENEVGIKIQGNCIVLKYVHELQHALRLAGLNDLATNFKV